MALQPVFLEFALITSSLILYIVGRTPLTGDQPIARALPVHRIAQALIQTSKLRVELEPTSPVSGRRYFLTQAAQPPWSVGSCMDQSVGCNP
jgi:hypothetical protein